MATLRSAFIDTFRPAGFYYFGALPFYQLPFQQLSNNDDIKKQAKGIVPTSLPSPTTQHLYLRAAKALRSSSLHTMIRLLNENINNLSEISDINSNDFKGCENFIHVLQLDQDNQNEFKLSELDTVKSISVMENSGRLGDWERGDRCNIVQQDEDEVSILEDFTPEI